VLWAVLALTRHVRADTASRFTLPRVDTAAIDTITLQKPGDSVTLARAARGRWTVNAHPADSARVSDLLRVLADTSSWGELAAESRQSYAGLGVGSDSGQRVRVMSHGKVLLDITTGKRTSDAKGIYLRRGTDSAVYALHGANVGDPFSRTVDDWRDKRIASIAPDSVVTAEVHRGSASYTVRRAKAGWTIDAGPAADSSSVANWLVSFQNLSASGFATPAQADSAHFGKPRAAITIRGKGTVPLLSLAFDSTAGGVWARADSGGPVYRVDTWQLGQLVPAESTLKAKRKP
ncbi:MAG TPA: DUF4340 domain-containing protein, partial [Gemmatimonadaceae bacterium]|nr:DUF4340 domain-containing protein [Gemmatimonadaceae bacterium]